LRAAFFRRGYKRVKNSSGSEIPPYSVLRVVSAAVSNNEILYTVAQANTTFQRLYMVSWPFKIGSGSSAEGMGTFLSEGGYVRYNSGTPVYGTGWGPVSGTWGLAQYQYGFSIMGGNTTASGNNVTIAKQDAVSVIYGQTDGAITDGSTGTVEVYDGNNSAITSVTVSAAHRFSATTIADNSKVSAKWIGGVWVIDAARCP
jgi:hypothetical protein